MDIDYKNKYLKYKNKYIILQNNIKNSKLLSENNNIQQSGGGKMDIMLFKAEWCGHCKMFKSTWDKLKENFNKKFNFITYDSVKDAAMIKQMDISGYPTIMFKDNVLTKSYDGPRDYESLYLILDNMTNK